MEEVEIKEYTRYIVNEDGQVWSKYGKGKFLKPRPATNGYLQVLLCNGVDKAKNILVHKLVADAFIPKRDGANQINHIDGDKTNNKLSNLERVSPSENMKHAFEIGLSKKGEDHHNSKLSNQNIIEMREKYLSGNYTQQQLAKEYGISQGHVSEIVNQKKRI